MRNQAEEICRCETRSGLGLISQSLPSNDGLPPESCACLATLYLCMDELRRAGTLDISTGIPLLRDVTIKATEVVQCPICPSNFMWAMQNSQIINTLILSIAQSYRSVYESIDDETRTAQELNEKKLLQVGVVRDDGQLPPLQIGLSGSSSFTLSLSPTEWQNLAKNALRDQIVGAPHLTHTSFLDMLQLLEDRQVNWHSNMAPDDFRNHRHGHQHGRPHGQEPICVMMIKQARSMVDQL